MEKYHHIIMMEIKGYYFFFCICFCLSSNNACYRLLFTTIWEINGRLATAVQEHKHLTKLQIISFEFVELSNLAHKFCFCNFSPQLTIVTNVDPSVQLYFALKQVVLTSFFPNFLYKKFYLHFFNLKNTRNFINLSLSLSVCKFLFVILFQQKNPPPQASKNLHHMYPT